MIETELEAEAQSENTGLSDINAALSQLADLDAKNDPDYDPEAEKQAQAEAEQAEQEAEAEAEQQAVSAQESAEQAAAFGLSSIEFAIRAFVHPRYELPAKAKADALERFPALLAKYGALLPGWCLEYKEEIMAGKAAFGLVRDSLVEVKRLKAEDSAIKAEQDNAQQESAEQAA